MMTLDLLRHGETELGGGFRGSLDDLLTPVGWQQMRDATAQPAPWDAIISSPLRRCADFAFELAQQCRAPLVLLEDLRELHFGDWEGRHASELMVEHADDLGRFWTDPYQFTPPGGEQLASFEQRVLNAIGELYQRRAGEHLLLVTHGGVMRLLAARARGLAREGLLQVEVGHGQRLRLQVREAGELHECPC
ncbi:alpha-ribazole phosphatase family protein [Halopseudomonas bauzanensis]|uniref:Alpha-ribazole phosphatase n=1 Tax=Halopseudomonas bauzanensis TaxID=653930 RepID=A0A1H9UQH1_9GAMM|nr:alpha-ribazole phosphatase [Halopseudomonas bauzanensis]SFM11021.1 alpha-ribazole phosphatase [Halopseudomonas bauzanensis]